MCAVFHNNDDKDVIQIKLNAIVDTLQHHFILIFFGLTCKSTIIFTPKKKKMTARYLFIKQLFSRENNKYLDNRNSNLFTTNLFS